MMIRAYRVLAVVAVAALAVALPASLRADPKYLPSDTSAVMVINVKQILGSDLVKGQKDGLDKLKELIEGGGGAEAAAALKALKDAGFDILKDLHTIMGGTANPREPESGFMIIKGNFQLDKIHDVASQLAKDNGDALKISKSGTTNVYEISPPGGANTLYAAFASKDVLLASGSKQGLTDGIARVNGTKKAAHSKELKALLATIKENQSMSFIATGEALADIKNNPQIPFADTVEGISGFVTLGKGVQFQVGVLTKDADSAKQLAAGLGLLLEFGKNALKQKKDDPKMEAAAEVMNALRLTAQGSQAVLRGEITPEMIEKLKKLAPGQ